MIFFWYLYTGDGSQDLCWGPATSSERDQGVSNTERERLRSTPAVEETPVYLSLSRQTAHARVVQLVYYCTYKYAYIHTYTHTYTRAKQHMYGWFSWYIVSIDMYIHTHTHTYIHIYTHIHSVCVWEYTHTHIHTHIHTQRHAHSRHFYTEGYEPLRIAAVHPLPHSSVSANRAVIVIQFSVQMLFCKKKIILSATRA